jgi:hypothetical protein
LYSHCTTGKVRGFANLKKKKKKKETQPTNFDNEDLSWMDLNP